MARGGGIQKDGKWMTYARLLRHGDEIRFDRWQVKVRVVEKKPKGIVLVHVLDPGPKPDDLKLLELPAGMLVELVSRQVVDTPKKQPKTKKGQLKLL